MTHDFWLMAGIGTAGATILYWIARTRTSPFYWFALCLLVIEAALRQALTSVALCGRHYWSNWRETWTRVRREAAGPAVIDVDLDLRLTRRR